VTWHRVLTPLDNVINEKEGFSLVTLGTPPEKCDILFERQKLQQPVPLFQ
jgi:hypothetical protein